MPRTGSEICAVREISLKGLLILKNPTLTPPKSTLPYVAYMQCLYDGHLYENRIHNSNVMAFFCFSYECQLEVKNDTCRGDIQLMKSLLQQIADQNY